MIKSFRGGATHRFALEGKSKFSGLDIVLAALRLSQLDRARSLEDLSLPSFRLHKLKGNLQTIGQSA